MLGVQTDSGSFLPVTVDGKGRSVPETAKLRAHGCRFRRAAVSLTCYGEGRPRILCLALTADSAE